MPSFNKRQLSAILKYVDRTILYLSFLSSLLILFHTGYNADMTVARLVDSLIVNLFYVFGLVLVTKLIFRFIARKPAERMYYGELVLCFYFCFVIFERAIQSDAGSIFQLDGWLYVGIFGVLLIEVSKSSLFFDNFYFNPTILFVMSFLGLVLLGTLLLMLPNTTPGPPLSFVDALFMATSGVCITGLSVIDLSTELTMFGQTVLMVLIQVGGLGIMTFTGFFGYFFSGGFSYKNQLMYSEILGQNKVGSVISTLFKIVFITLFFEALGAVLIYFSMDADVFTSNGERLFFAVFHSISAFCNAGFSTAADGMYNPALRFNYALQVVIALLFILGGFGFAIVLNTYVFIKRWIINIYKRVVHGRPFIYQVWVMSFNSRLIAWITLVFILFGTVSTFMLEYNHTLSEHPSWWGKWVVAFFTGTSSRTAGLNVVDMDGLALPTIMLTMLLMWIGGSPGSTAGGIKTTTFTVAFLNIISLARGKDKLEIFKRQVSPASVNKAFAIIMLSLLAVGLSVLALTITDGDKELKDIAFECFSAYATCGLSLGLTPELSAGGKVVITITMFIGRVGLLTLLVAFIKDIRKRNLAYPEEEILF